MYTKNLIYRNSGNNKGTALSFVKVKEKAMMEEVEEHLRDWIPPGQESIFKYL